MSFVGQYLAETVSILDSLDYETIDSLADRLGKLKGRLFILGVGGSAATASHAVNDFRKLAGIETYAPTDNVAELTARTNDDGWPSTFRRWLAVSRVARNDAVLVLSVGGGGPVSQNIVLALDYAKTAGAGILGVVGRDGGHTAKVADCCLVIPPMYEHRITPHTEEIASVVLHLLVSRLCSQ